MSGSCRSSNGARARAYFIPPAGIFGDAQNFYCQEHCEFVRMESMTKNKQKNPASLRRSVISIIVGTAAVIRRAELLGIATGNPSGSRARDNRPRANWKGWEINQTSYVTLLSCSTMEK